MRSLPTEKLSIFEAEISGGECSLVPFGAKYLQVCPESQRYHRFVSRKLLILNIDGGGRGIRTPGTLSGTTVFKTAGINRSPIPPRGVKQYLDCTAKPAISVSMGHQQRCLRNHRVTTSKGAFRAPLDQNPGVCDLRASFSWRFLFTPAAAPALRRHWPRLSGEISARWLSGNPLPGRRECR
jgi:hypothetical protein